MIFSPQNQEKTKPEAPAMIRVADPASARIVNVLYADHRANTTREFSDKELKRRHFDPICTPRQSQAYNAVISPSVLRSRCVDRRQIPLITTAEDIAHTSWRVVSQPAQYLRPVGLSSHAQALLSEGLVDGGHMNPQQYHALLVRDRAIKKVLGVPSRKCNVQTGDLRSFEAHFCVSIRRGILWAQHQRDDLCDSHVLPKAK